MPIIVQQDATVYSLFISVNRSTCFGRYLHPSSAAHVTVSTVSGITVTVTATCRERHWMETAVPIQSRSRQVAVTPDGGRRYHPKHVERFTDRIKLYIVASCTIIGTYFTMHGPLNVKSCFIVNVCPFCSITCNLYVVCHLLQAPATCFGRQTTAG